MLSMLCTLLVSGVLCAAPPPIMDREQAAQYIASHYPGKILDLQPVTTSDGQAYRVKLLQASGRVKLMLIDAQDGTQRAFGSPVSKE